MVEPVLFHGSFPQVDLFDNHTVQVCCLRILHLLLVVENQRVISLRPEEMVGLPLAARQLRCLPAVDNRQRELDAAALQLPVGNEIEEEVIEQLVGRLRHRRGGNHLRGRVDGVSGVTVLRPGRIRTGTVCRFNLPVRTACGDRHHGHTDTYNK